MDGFGPEIVADVLAACQSGVGEIGGALSRTLDVTVQVGVSEAQAWQPESSPAGFDGPGLVLSFKLGDSGAVVAIDESSGLLPAWCAAPDPTGRSKLATLSQELSMLLLPERFLAESSDFAYVKSVSEAIARTKASPGAKHVPLTVTTESGSPALLHLVWPIAFPGKLAESEDQPAEKTANAAKPAAVVREPAFEHFEDDGRSVEELPSYAQSLLRIEVPLSVTLASKRQTVQGILELGTGAIIQFEKSCDEMLDLSVGNQPIAKGEAVKVGDKFGLRITSFVLPDEQFVPLGQSTVRASPSGPIVGRAVHRAG